MQTCKKCGSPNIKKNGHTPGGRQKYYCHDCGVHTTTDEAARERAARMELVERLAMKRLSQRDIARASGVSRPTIIAYLRRKVAALWNDSSVDARTTDSCV